MTRKFRTILSTTALVAALVGTPVASVAQVGHLTDEGTQLAQIETPDQAVAFANVQNLVARWNTIITQTSTGEEQLQVMLESGVFAEDFTIAFNLPDGTRIALEGLDTDDARGFYNQTVNGLQKARANVASNVEVTAFGRDEIRARFRYVVFMGDRYSLGGINEITVEVRDGRYQIAGSEIFVERFDTDHAR
ncbi:hypothetical protein V8J82_23025 [Gymnodinialimonas sp. 2305UL16-5]|uniref:hypothetical protein n=1 Tax=Gymnodinialimonas mytili TaxID=3126503 RepID=UPI00309EE8FB